MIGAGREGVLAGAGPKALAAGGLVALAAAIGIGRFVYTPILPLMVEDLGITKATAGLIASANFAGYLTGALLAATPLVRGSRRRWLVAALGVSAVTTAAMAVPSSVPAFLGLRFAGGVASAFVLVFASALVLDRLAAIGRPGLSALHFAGVGTGIAVAAVVVSSLGALGLGWRAQWLASGAVALVALGVVPALVPNQGEAAPAPVGSAQASDRRLTTLIVAYGLFGFGYVVTATFLVAIVRGSPTVRALEPVVWLVVGLTAAPSVAPWTAVAMRIGVARTFALACVIEALGTAAVLWTAASGVLIAAAVLGGTFMGLTALGLIGARRLARGDPRRTIATMTASFGLGQIVGPAFAGFAHDATGSYALPVLTAAAALLVAAILVLAAFRNG